MEITCLYGTESPEIVEGRRGIEVRWIDGLAAFIQDAIFISLRHPMLLSFSLLFW